MMDKPKTVDAWISTTNYPEKWLAYIKGLYPTIEPTDAVEYSPYHTIEWNCVPLTGKPSAPYKRFTVELHEHAGGAARYIFGYLPEARTFFVYEHVPIRKMIT